VNASQHLPDCHRQVSSVWTLRGPDSSRCVHGNPSWSFLWRELLSRLPSHYRVIAVDQLDMGFSERSGLKRTLTTRIDDLCQLTDYLEINGPVVTVAHDWGGPVSLGWAHRHRAMLKGIVLTNTAVHQPEHAAAPAVIRLIRNTPLLKLVTARTQAFIHCCGGRATRSSVIYICMILKNACRMPACIVFPTLHTLSVKTPMSAAPSLLG